jgi:hypothetical protein
MAARRAGKFAVELKNLRELKVQFRDMAKAISGDKHSGILQQAGLAIQEAYGAAARLIRDRARSNASGGGAPRRLYAGARPAIFAFSDFDAGRDDKRKRSSLVGVRTGLSTRTRDPHLFVQWHPKLGTRKKDGSNLQSGGLSMSLAALFERGTKDRRIRPLRYFRSALFATRGQVIGILTRAYQSAGAKINSIK